MSPVAAREVDIEDPEERIEDTEKNEQKAKTLSTQDTIMMILPAAAGSFIEWYDFAIYSYISPYITANFFEELGGSVGTWAGFGITFLFRPLGGLVFGYLADTLGRKCAMQITIATMLATSVLQGVLPSFVWPGKGWGWLGTVLLLLLRALQGLSAGGELATAVVYISEVSPKHALGLNLSWLSVFGAFGSWSVASLIVWACERILDPQAMNEYGWRIPYFIALVPGLIIVYFRQYLEESSDFEDLVEARAEANREVDGKTGSKKGPIREILENHKLGLFVASMGSACVGAFWFVPTFYGPALLQSMHPNISASSVTLSEGMVYLIPTVSAPLIGMLVDKWGAGKVYMLTVILCGIILPVPLFYWWGHLSDRQASVGMFIGQVAVGLCCALTTSIYAWIVEFFPVEVRVTGVSVAYNIGVGVFGGFGPLLCAALKGPLPPWGFISAPAAVSLFCGLLSLAALILGWVLAANGKLQLTHIREFPY